VRMENNIISFNFFKETFFKLPQIALILDKNRKIIGLNELGQKALNISEEQALIKMPGDIFHCVYVELSNRECGSNKGCEKCPCNYVISKALLSNKSVRLKGTIAIKEKDDSLKYLNVLISASPINYNDQRYLILTLEDISNITQIQGMVSICANCKNLLDRDHWKRLEKYIEDNTGAMATHTICPECIRSLYPQYAEKVLNDIEKS
ncbi:MAG: hypothetical protein ACOYJ1_17250, partial [Peptococcales bacterium]